ncbi:D-alanyl-D-alanine carboxypeptidase family protein [Oceanobacillus damuensis]|uniref:D-alanyl-D-alanine carboxypeptidase family protein n=1 Tax=Oceanobacillus damuensis TaxID=937928 RepID=UPI000832533D|nr:D-alanyl-D-alanine carboxypeptidase family protein [Oceanobacillus damuensis]
MKKITLLIATILAIIILNDNRVYAETSSKPPTLHSESAFLMEANTGEILYEKNGTEPMYPASVTKIATAIFAIETGNLEDIVTISSEASAKNVEGTTVFLDEGEQVTLEKLVQGLLINSGNDAGVAIAEHLSGSMEQFSEDINAYLENVIGTEQTNFKNPHGLFDDKHVTTAEDLAKITLHAMQNDKFMDIFGKKELEWDGKTWDTTIRNHHKLVKEEIPYIGITGGKNGFVSKSGFTLVTTAERDDLHLVAVTLKTSLDSEAYEDTISLLDYGFENFTVSSIEEGTEFTVEGQEYVAPETLSFLHSVEEQPKEIIEEDGLVKIVDGNETITAFQLEKYSDGGELEARNTAVESHETSIFDNIFVYFLIAFILGIFILVNVAIRKRNKRRYARNNRYFL